MKRCRYALVALLSLPMAPLLLEAQAPAPISAEAAQLAEGNLRFALDLYAELAEAESGNLFLSPWSISTAFGMAWAGARGETSEEMAEVLHFPWEQEETHPLFAELIESVNSVQTEGKITLETANAMWPAIQFTVLPEYRDILVNDYQAYAESLDYLQNLEDSRLRINEWVAGQTGDRISDLIPQGMLSSRTSLVLTNAIYFKGAWQTLFDPEKTEGDFFTTEDGNEVAIQMMHLEEDLFYFEDPSLILVTLPYHGEELEAVLIAPKEGTVRDLESTLTPENLSSWLDQRGEGEVRVRLPRFSLRYKASLVDSLKSLGMQLPFDPGQADFSGIFGSRDQYISAVIHETFLQVKEEGTEAAAATGIGFEFTSVPTLPTFDGDRPFLFLIRDTLTGSLLFMGRVAKPEPVEEEPAGGDPELVKEVFGETSNLSAGWWEDTAIGRFKADAWPWLDHESLGWLYLDIPPENTIPGYWLYDFSFGWLYTAPGFYPNLWSAEEDWILHVSGQPRARWFYSHAEGIWFSR